MLPHAVVLGILLERSVRELEVLLEVALLRWGVPKVVRDQKAPRDGEETDLHVLKDSLQKDSSAYSPGRLELGVRVEDAGGSFNEEGE